MHPTELDRRNFLRISTLLAGSSAFLVACGGSSSSTASSAASGPATAAAGASGGAKPDFGKVAVQLSWIKNIEFAGEYFATTKGYYTDAGFSSVNLLAGGAAGTSVESGLVSGKAWIGLSAPTITAPAVNAGAPLKIVGATYQKNPFCIVSLKAKAINTPKDMIGRKIGVQTGGNDVIFKALLTANNIDPKDITIIPVQYDPTVVTTGDVEGFMAYSTNEPILLHGKGFETTTMLMADYGLPLVAETYTVLQETIDKQRDKLKAFLVAEIKGWKDAVAAPDQSAALAVHQFGKDQKLDLAEQTEEATAQNELIVSADTKSNGLFTISDSLIAENIEALGRAGIKIAADKLFDMSLINEIYQQQPALKA